jgi:hypothetical protein
MTTIRNSNKVYALITVAFNSYINSKNTILDVISDRKEKIERNIKPNTYMNITFQNL